jgi:hypothetical protein
MTRRAILLGLIGAAAISGYTHFNDCVIHQSRLVPHLMPGIVYGSAFLFLLLINPILRRVRARWVFTGREMAVIMAFALIACSVPSLGLIQSLPTSIMLPRHLERLKPGWSQKEVTSIPPKPMMPDPTPDEETILNGYVMGLGEGDEHIGFFDVPWGAWRAPLLFWMPLLLSITFATLGLAVVFHRQWSTHEQLPYPIARFARAFLPEAGEVVGGVLRQRLFWVGFGTVFLIGLNNYLYRWWPQVFIPIRMFLDFTPLSSLFPTLIEGHGIRLLRPSIMFSVVGLSYFLASDVSFSMGIGPFIFCTIAGILSKYGVVLRTGHHQSVKLEAFLFTGGYTGIVAMLLYTGRHYYWNVLRKSVGLASKERIERSAVLGMRVFLAGSVFFIAQLVVIGLDWQLALLYTVLSLIVFTAVSRTIAETGAFYIGTEVFPGAILWGFFGTIALGPQTMVIMFLVTVVLLVGPGWAPMPFAVQALKLVDSTRAPVGRTAAWLGPVLLLSVAIAVPAILYWQYDRGALFASTGWPRYACTFPFENMVQVTNQLEAQGTMELSRSLSGWKRFVHAVPTYPAVAAFLIALGLSVAIGMGRLRFVHWPFHPVMFVFLGGAQALTMSGSFTIGWILKSLVSKYGGERLYESLKPLMIGIIAGDMVAQFVPMIVATVYYAVTGTRP